jgi:hypothetical protein
MNMSNNISSSSMSMSMSMSISMSMSMSISMSMSMSMNLSSKSRLFTYNRFTAGLSVYMRRRWVTEAYRNERYNCCI